jgi:uncharacterized membrane protein YGL010W
MNARLELIFSKYHEFHRTHGNQICHNIGIPMIVVSTFGLLALIPLVPHLDAGMLLWLGSACWYVFLDWRLGIPFSGVALASYFLGRTIPLSGLVALFVAGWIFQGIGHAIYEKRRPAFLTNFTQLLVGPFWIFAKLIRFRR